MKLYKSASYDRFHCLAGACPDTCCQEWDILVDPETAAFYETIPGALGEKVRASLHTEDGETVITLADGHCPMQRSDGLCLLQAQLGEQALCQVCREFPRLHHDYGDFMELNLELSCPEAARLLLQAPDFMLAPEEIPGGTEPDYDEDAMEILLSTRQEVLQLLLNPHFSVKEALVLVFFYGVRAQSLLDGEDVPSFDASASLETAVEMQKPGNFRDICNFFLQMEILTPEWKELLCAAAPAPLSPCCRNLAAYLIRRYWLQAVSDYDLYCRVKFILISCILLSSLPGDFIWNAHLFSKEIENDIDNVDAILDAAYGDPIFTDDKLLSYLLKTGENNLL